MKRSLIAAAIALAAMSSNAQARHSHHRVSHVASYAADPGCNIIFPCEGVAPSARGLRVVKAMHGFGTARQRYTPVSSLGGRPAGCPHAWCGCWLMHHLGVSDRRYWQARAWAGFGSRAGGPAEEVIAVWPHHVGLIKAVEGNRILLLSGNDGRAVRQRWRTTAGIIAFRRT